MSKAVIVLHGGAGALSCQTMSEEKERDYRQALDAIARSGQTILANGGSALDAVTEAVRLLEEFPLFNAGTGAVFTHQGAHELDASVRWRRTVARYSITMARPRIRSTRFVSLVLSGPWHAIVRAIWPPPPLPAHDQ